MALFKLTREDARYFSKLPQLEDDAADYLVSFIEQNPKILDPSLLDKPLLLISRVDYPTDDIRALFVGLNDAGNLAVAAVSHKAASRNVVDYALKYAWELRDKSYKNLNEITGAYFKEKGKEFASLAQAHKDHFNLESMIEQNQFNSTQQVTLLAPEYPEEVMRRLAWASFRTSISALKLEYRSTDGEGSLKTEQTWFPSKRWGFLADAITGPFKKGGAEAGAKPPWAASLDKRFQGVLGFFSRIGISELALSYFLLFIMILIYAIVFTYLSIRDQNGFGTFAADLGIFDQGVWLLSQGKNAFVTVRGLHLFGDHADLILLMLVPFYWIWSDVRVLLISQTFALALGALPIYWLAKDKLKNRWLSLVFPLSYLLYPALQWSNWDDFHPDTFATPLILFSFYFLTKKKYTPFAIFTFLTLLVKEEMALTVFALGIYIFFRYSRKLGIVTSLFSLSWFIFLIYIFIPYFNPKGFIYFTRVYGTGGSGIIGLLFNPGLLFSLLTRERLLYLFQLLVPVAFLPLLSLSTFAISIPALATNLLSALGYQYMIRYHYTVLITPIVFISTIYAFAKIKRPDHLRSLALVLLLASFVSNVYLSPSPISKSFNQGIWAKPTDRHKIIRQAMSLIPKDGAVSAHYLFVPHLSQREKIYVYPNPFRTEYWGVNDQNPHNPKVIEYILVDTKLLTGESLKFTKSLIRGKKFKRIFSKDGVTLLNRR